MKVVINGHETEVVGDMTVAAALLNSGVSCFRRAVTAAPRAPLCGMGICFECRVTIDGIAHVRSCMVSCREGMVIQTDVNS